VAWAHGVFHACEKIFCDVNNPPRLMNRQLVEWFGTIPDARSLPPLPPKKFAKLLNWLAGLEIDATSTNPLSTAVAGLTAQA
jgi:hypothetical protein